MMGPMTMGESAGAAPLHLKTLTAMRWFAAAMVILPHLYMHQLPGALEYATKYSTTGVMFFFMLSGFVLTWSMKDDDSKRRFYGRRFARIYPLHLATLGLSIAVIYLEGRQPGWAALPFSLTLTQAWLPTGAVFNAFNSLSWSISCEAFFYALFPFIAPRIIAMGPAGRQKLLLVAGSIIIAKSFIIQATAGMDSSIVGGLTVADLGHWGGYYFPPVRLAEFVVGILIACAVKDGYRSPISLPKAAALAAFAYAGVSFIPSLGLGSVDSIMFLPVALLVLAGASRDLSAARTPRPFFVLLGQASFAMYMIQELILRVLRVYQPELFTAGVVVPLVAALITICLISAASIPVHLWFEGPIEQRLRPRRSAVPVELSPR